MVFSLSPGERVGVRASVNSFFTEYVEEAVLEYWGFQHSITSILHHSVSV
jgi:hypothetical protein